MLRTTLLLFLSIILTASASEETLSSSLERTASTGSEREELTEDKTSRVFGSNLFSSEKRELIASAFNPAYVIQNGDNIRVQIWGAYTFNDALRVDEQGNVFIPEVGPILVAGAQNKDLTSVLMAGIGDIYTQHINLYANLETSQEVKVFVAGYAKNPGLYAGHASDNLLNYIHLAGGIDLMRGSFTSIQIKRGSHTRETVDLYDFLTKGEIPQVQFSDGDVIFVSPVRNRLIVDGLVSNPYQFEFNSDVMSGMELERLAQPLQTATHFTIQRSLGDKTNALTYEITSLPEIELKAGDKIVFSANRQKNSILIKVEGEHDGAGFISLAYGTSLGELYDNFEFNSYSSSGQIQLFRESTRARQKSAILDSLKRLEDSILSARSSTSEESLLRLNEANLLLKFIDRAAQVEPLGQVILNSENWRSIRLEDNDKIISFVKNLKKKI